MEPKLWDWVSFATGATVFFVVCFSTVLAEQIFVVVDVAPAALAVRAI